MITKEMYINVYIYICFSFCAHPYCCEKKKVSFKYTRNTRIFGYITTTKGSFPSPHMWKFNLDININNTYEHSISHPKHTKNTFKRKFGQTMKKYLKIIYFLNKTTSQLRIEILKQKYNWISTKCLLSVYCDTAQYTRFNFLA